MLKVTAALCAILLSCAPALAADPIVPDPVLTPGGINNPPTPLATLCTPGYTNTVRHVKASQKKFVFEHYGIDPKGVDRKNYEVDHLISLELDGSNATNNLWPESYVSQPMNAHRKDQLENKLKHLVCTGKLPLVTAQFAISKDWIAAYSLYVVGSKAQ